jgi:hypothetical protein
VATVEVCYTRNTEPEVVERLRRSIASQGVQSRSREVPHGKKALGDWPPEITLVVGALVGAIATKAGDEVADALGASIVALLDRIGLDTVSYVIVVQLGDDKPEAVYRIPSGDDEELALRTLGEHAKANPDAHFQRHWHTVERRWITNEELWGADASLRTFSE